MVLEREIERRELAQRRRPWSACFAGGGRARVVLLCGGAARAVVDSGDVSDFWRGH